jgi:glycosyltransferase involved in cell wall biosynthesis
VTNLAGVHKIAGGKAPVLRIHPPTGSIPKPEVVLDLSRLLSRVHQSTPTGVDRVEMAYARGLMREIPDRLRFAALHPNGLYGRLDPRAVAYFLDETEATWGEEGHGGAGRRWLRSARALLALHPRRVPANERSVPRVYVQASPHHLDREERVAAILRRERARFVCLVHDLIPIEFPEYARAGGAEQHRRRIATIVRHADGIVTNSAATRASLSPFVTRSGRSPLISVAHLGVPTTQRGVAELACRDRPYFVCVGTIEPRKNHLLLLNIWRRMAQSPAGGDIPKLVLIGRRGWENEQIVDMLERCPALRGHVEEHGRLADREVGALIAGARALLMPSFAEGYGMPVTEALALGTPVICSDLPALREGGGNAPTYLDPLDGPAWIAAITTAAGESGRGAIRSVDKLSALPNWSDHIAILLDLVHRLPA